MNVKDIEKLRTLSIEITSLNKKVGGLKKRKRKIEDRIILAMEAEESLLVKTKHGTVSISKTDVASVKNWTLFEDYIYENRALHLLQRRASNDAYREEVKLKGEIPGVETFEVIALNLTKKPT